MTKVYPIHPPLGDDARETKERHGRLAAAAMDVVNAWRTYTIRLDGGARATLAHAISKLEKELGL